jgi:phosphatidylglycerol:prolipoprotein diacylglycerol transferase
MHPIIYFGPLEISTYAVMLSVGASLGFWLTYRDAERKGLDIAEVLKLTAVAFAAGLIGARGLVWLARPAIYEERPFSSIFVLWDRSGMSLYGGLALAALAGFLYARARGHEIWDIADTLAFAFLPAIALARLGCFLNGCCYGKPTTAPWGLVAGGAPNYVNFEIPSHPTQLYEAAAALLLFALLERMRWTRQFVGQLTVAFLAGYPLFRFFNEILRGDPRPGWQIGGLGVLSLNQILSVAALLFALAAGMVLERRGAANGSEAGGTLPPRNES